MTLQSPPSLQDRVARLRHAYLAKLPQTLDEATRVCALLSRTPRDNRAVDDLLRCFHNIKGTAASLGLPEISAESAATTGLVAQIQDLAPASRDGCLDRTLAGISASIARLDALRKDALMREPLGRAPFETFHAVSPGKAAETPRRRVVFYCDDDVNSAELGMQLSRFGYAFTSFTDPTALKAAVLADPPDAIVISTASTEIVADLRRSVEVPALFVSRRTDFETRLKAVQAGGEAFFLKPVAAHDIVEALDKVTVRRVPDPFRILIVDDEPEMTDYHAAILESANMVVHRLDRTDKILEELAEFLPDLVLMDMYMPTSSGRELSRVIRQMPQFVGLPIIYLSSETDKKIQTSLMRVGADGFLTKPVVPEELISAIVIRAERTRVLRSLMTRDSLTGLFNHTTLSLFLDSALAGAGRDSGRLCFVMLDLDHFKEINDTYGHPAGDQVLMALARILKQRLRTSDMVGRYGGEEFAIILQDATVPEAVNIVDQIRRDFTTLVFTAGDREFSCSFSGGVAGFPESPTADTLIQAADQALYSAKRKGRNRVMMACPESLAEEMS